MIQVKDGQVIKTKLPKNGFLSNGRAVSNYNYLPEKVLKEEGWIEPVEVIPTLKSSEELGAVKYEEVKGKWVKSFEVVRKLEPMPTPEPIPDPMIEIKERLAILESMVSKEVVAER